MPCFHPTKLRKAKNIIAQLGQLNLKQNNKGGKKQRSRKNDDPGAASRQKQKGDRTGNDNNGTGCLNLLPSEFLVIAGIICDVLQVELVLITRRQTIEIVLTGSLQRRTQLDKVMEQIGKMPFDKVIQSIMICSSEDH